MRLFHININYFKNKVFQETFEAFEQYTDFHNTVIVPDRVNSRKKESDKLILLKVIRKYYKFFFLFKEWVLFNALIKRVDFNSLDYVLGYSLFSDGFLAYSLKKERGISYSIIVRNTDVNYFLKYRIYLYPLAKLVIENADNIILVNPGYTSNLVKLGLLHSKDDVRYIPNGLSEYWLSQNVNLKSKINPERIKLIFVGNDSKNKNVEFVEKIAINDNNIYQLNIIGEFHIKNLSPKIFYHGYVKEKEKLRRFLIENDILVLPSKNETFGMVILEACSVGVVPVFTKGFGVEAFLPKVFENLTFEYNSSASFYKALKYAVQNKELVLRSFSKSKNQFAWENIVKSYLEDS